MYRKSMCSLLSVLVAVLAQSVVEAKPVTPNYEAKTIGVAESQNPDMIKSGKLPRIKGSLDPNGVYYNRQGVRVDPPAEAGGHVQGQTATTSGVNESIPRVSGFLAPDGTYYNRQGERVAPPAEAGVSLRGQTMATTPGVNESAPRASGLLSPNGMYQGMRSPSPSANDVQQGVLGLNPNVDLYECKKGSGVVQCKTTKTISNDGKGGWSKKNVAAYYAAEQLFIDGQCFAGQDKEAALLLLKKGNKYFYGYKSEYVLDRDAHSSAPVNIEKYRKELEDQGYSVVGVVHNHPLSAPGARTVFSQADMANAQMKTDGRPAIDCYMVSCDDSSMGASGGMKLYRYVGAEDKAYVVKADGSQDPADYIKGAASAADQATSTLNGATQGKVEGASDQKAGAMKDVDSQIAIDTSKLEELLKQQNAFLNVLIAKDERASNRERHMYNSQQEKIVQEGIRIAQQINALPGSNEEKMRIAEKVLAKANELNAERIRLVKLAMSRKLVDVESMPILPIGDAKRARTE